jgi:hypothetical protein
MSRENVIYVFYSIYLNFIFLLRPSLGWTSEFSTATDDRGSAARQH